MKFLISNIELTEKLASDFESLSFGKIGKYNYLINDQNCLSEDQEFFNITNGYLRDLSQSNLNAQKSSASKKVFHQWPVENDITGTFSSVIINKNSDEITISTDLVNIYPLYYLIEKKRIFISNSLILLGRYSKAFRDLTGIFQRAVGPDFENIGSRTILKNCKAILPGEWIKISNEGSILQRKYDNSLYAELSKSNEIIQANEYWEIYKKEVDLCTSGFSNINIALSGGIDSRIVLGAVSDKKNIHTYTYGRFDNYENQIARKLSSKKKSEHKSLYDPAQYFPNKETFYSYVQKSEAVKLNSWIEFLENIQKTEKEPLLTGELCEGLPARNLKRLNSDKFRKKNFFKYYIKKDQIEFIPLTQNNFETWKKHKLSNLYWWNTNHWFKQLGFEKHEKQIREECLNDAEEIFERIEAHKLFSLDLCDELYSWYTFTRKQLSRHINICNEKFYAFSPGMSLQILRKTSNIHPNQRLFYRFANRLLNTQKDLKKFSFIPTNQIPIVPQNSHNFIKIPVWGLRSKIDDFLVKRMMKSGKSNRAYRLFKSINWAKIYHLEDMKKNMESYYDPNHLTGEYALIFKNLADNRKKLKKWPFANMDIMSGAALNAELDLIDKKFN